MRVNGALSTVGNDMTRGQLGGKMTEQDKNWELGNGKFKSRVVKSNLMA